VRSAVKALLWLVAAALGLGALGCTVLFVQAARLPYSEQGRHFESGVVHEVQAVGVYGVVALSMALLALLLGWLARRMK
ncbi:MAG: hypothetical protein K0M70_13075, partial [Arenimonas sp.]|uniref:hypothetical protein n=1 Tax=Arenimonas sp. TaxID=1872635 RepID=UPI0025BB2B27